MDNDPVCGPSSAQKYESKIRYLAVTERCPLGGGNDLVQGDSVFLSSPLCSLNN